MKAPAIFRVPILPFKAEIGRRRRRRSAVRPQPQIEDEVGT
jgi:hypothetical protein